jgi:alkylation response protein AidB-like acyl-CoA dehydrogenase
MPQPEDTAEQALFRSHCREWLDANRPAEPSFRIPELPIEVTDDACFEYLRTWQRECHAAGLVGCDYPTEYGGGGHSGFQGVANQEMSRADVPYLINVIGLGMAAPTILHHGTEAQKRRFLPPLLSADEIWCQGFSEPGAGSDLASVQTWVERNGDEWVLSGHKVWTSLAHYAKWMIILCRTSRHHKYDGLSFFVAPISDTPGVTVRPLIKMTGESGFNEVLFESVGLPDSLRIDEIGKGWTVAMTTLTHERGAAEGAGSGGGVSIATRVEKLIELAHRIPRNGATAWEDPVLRDRIVQIAIRAEGMQQTFRRMGVAALSDHPMRLPLQTKLLMTELLQDLAELALEVSGAHSTLYLGDPNAPDGAEWPLAYLGSFGSTIAAGTSEVQRNILGERVLGLAKSK